MKFTLEIQLSELRNIDVETILQDVARQFHVPGTLNRYTGKVHHFNVEGTWEIAEDASAD
jgi:hypothetical protein